MMEISLEEIDEITKDLIDEDEIVNAFLSKIDEDGKFKRVAAKLLKESFVDMRKDKERRRREVDRIFKQVQAHGDTLANELNTGHYEVNTGHDEVNTGKFAVPQKKAEQIQKAAEREMQRLVSHNALGNKEELRATKRPSALRRERPLPERAQSLFKEISKKERSSGRKNRKSGKRRR